MAVRDYAPSDFHAVCRIYLDAKPAELASEPGQFVFTPLDRDPVLLTAFNESEVVVHDAGDVLGFAAMFDGQLRALFVHSLARGRGVGQSLLDMVIARAETPIALNVALGNSGAIRFYERNGFSIIGETTRQYNGIDVQYVRMLREQSKP
ncbi:GNAT family N-acetyltransferase [Duganella sp. FT94W]|uniref:GNAT family N-acetyltransferase n=1 Tax=Duganella lactea TaxID=2692173 RepID=A0ABW9V1G0_9BURK|nr:GNAT family N-acetyltransferase [Duganella lactea]MYM33551.1 GNAT family N-acetyltransferase [Duganella lactea]